MLITGTTVMFSGSRCSGLSPVHDCWHESYYNTAPTCPEQLLGSCVEAGRKLVTAGKSIQAFCVSLAAFLTPTMETAEAGFVTMLMERMQTLEEDNARLRQRVESLEYPLRMSDRNLFEFSDGITLLPRKSGIWQMQRTWLDKGDPRPLDQLHKDVVAFTGQVTIDLRISRFPQPLVMGSTKEDEGTTIGEMVEKMHVWFTRCEEVLRQDSTGDNDLFGYLSCGPSCYSFDYHRYNVMTEAGLPDHEHH